ncbi:hypothetical protein [Bradyrhizobium sp. 1]|uniref:hypothetical protein n=1 Tax=Bradyrhizobium sp. 1 TaxID=241591 RepID=UPI001FF93A5E|nr:hypothetical protein [Bradyrhizobium sp. 1]MCK1394308.1 hypothetical protein [Bradyrhizobium sp. 1]
MYEAVSNFTVPIALSMNDKGGKHLGTGSFVGLGGTTALVSCEHVLGKRKNNILTHWVRDQDRYIAIDGPEAYIVEPIDAAAAGISPVLWDEHWRKSDAIPEDRLAIVHDAVPNELFFVFGFAEENSEFFFDTLRVDGTAYLCREAKLPSQPRLDQQIHFELEYNRDLATKVFGDHDLPNPSGMSGSLVWNTRFMECAMVGKDWTPGYSDVAGMVWFWNENDVIAATRVEYIRSFLLRVATAWKRGWEQTSESDASQLEI